MSSSASATTATSVAPAPTSIEVADVGPVRLRVEVVREIPHDTSAFTQGLLFDGSGRLFESTGLEGSSTLRELDPETGAVLRSEPLAADVFGEGLALVDDRLIQLTWQDALAFVYDVDTFGAVTSFSYEGEGWGLCYDGARLVMSNGSAELTFRDPQTFTELGSVTVTAGDDAVTNLNELECVGDEVYANVFETDTFVIVDPDDGAVRATVDASSLPRPDGADVLNGIAVAPDGGLWLTGKLWPAMYEVALVPA